MVIGYALKDKKPKCPECGSTDMRKFGTKFVKVPEASATLKVKRVKQQQFQCNSCGRITVNPEWEDKDIGG